MPCFSMRCHTMFQMLNACSYAIHVCHVKLSITNIQNSQPKRSNAKVNSKPNQQEIIHQRRLFSTLRSLCLPWYKPRRLRIPIRVYRRCHCRNGTIFIGYRVLITARTVVEASCWWWQIIVLRKQSSSGFR